MFWAYVCTTLCDITHPWTKIIFYSRESIFFIQGIFALLLLELYLLNIPEYYYWDDCSSNRPTIAKDGDKSAHGLQPDIYKGEAEAVSPVEERQGNYDEKD